MINPSIWGPNIWQTLHFISLGYPENPTEQQKNDYKQFFLLLKTVLPCTKCAIHYKYNLEQLPLTNEILNNKQLFIKWVIDLHNSVNLLNGKPIINYEIALELIKKSSTCKHDLFNYTLFYLYLFICILIIIIIFYLYKNKYLKL